jgi:hypothetical protein
VEDSAEIRTVSTRYRIDASAPRSGITASSHYRCGGSCRGDCCSIWSRIATHGSDIAIVGSNFRRWTDTTTQPARIDDQLPAVCHCAPAIPARARTRIGCCRCTSSGCRGGITSAIATRWRRGTAPRGRCSGCDRWRGTGDITTLTASAHIRWRQAVAIATTTTISDDMPTPSISYA